MATPSNYKIYSTTQTAWAAMFEALRVAQKSIYWEVYMFLDDSAGHQFFDLLLAKTRAGVDVKLIIDYWGSFALSNKKVAALRAQGIDIRFFEDRKRRHLIWWGLFSSRTHRKMLIIDEKLGFVGGVNVGAEMRDWLDIHVALRGKTVRSLLRSFAKSYIRCGGDPQAVRDLFKYEKRVETDTVDVVSDKPNLQHSQVKKRYIEALLRARERVILFSPYYFPDKAFLNALWQAKKKGVRVDLLIPFRTDLRVASYAAYAWFSLMKTLGVNVHLMPKMMHGKGVIKDDDWALVGSSNIDMPSFHYNHEMNVRLNDKRAVRKLTRILNNWIKLSKPLDQKKWEQRGRWHKVKEWLAVTLYRFWFGGR